MKTIAPILFILLFIVSCKSAIKDEAVSEKETPEKVIEEIIEPVHSKVNDNATISSKEDLVGYWVGWFMPNDTIEKYERKGVVYMGEHRPWFRENKITLSIDTILGGIIMGHTIVAGNLRPFKGTLLFTNGGFFCEAAEPGDHKYDGTFSFRIRNKSDTLSGTWQSYKKIEVPKRKFNLQKKVFEYNPKNKIRNDFADWMKTKTKRINFEGDWEDMEAYFATTSKVTELNPSVNLLTQEQIEKLTKADIYVLRNSIYAKHGYSFKKRALRVFFDSHDWYMPVHVNIKSELTDIEKKNIKLLLRYEKYAEEYYDEFGRG